MNLRSVVAFCVLAVFIPTLTWSQSAPKANVAPDYSKQAYVIEHVLNRVSYEADGMGTRETTASILMTSDAGVQAFAVLSFPYASENEAVEIDYVRVRKADGSVIATPAYNIQDMPGEITRVAPMYSDLKEKHVTVKGLGVGDTLEYLVRYRVIKPEIPGQFWLSTSFAKDAITKDEELEISVPKDKYVKVSSPGLEPKVREEGSRKIYSWKSQVLEVKAKDKDYVPTEEDKKPSVQMTTFRSWEEIGRWYGGLQATQLRVTPEIQAKVAEITKDLKSDDEKIKAIYDYVATRFHYISLSFGIGRYQPHSAVDVLENEYGDCKDKHTLLATMLRAAGYDAWPALIGSDTKLDPDVPSPAQFDHVITAVPRPTGIVWLDTTTELGPFGFLIKPLRDKQTLVIPTDKAPSLMRTPAEPPFTAEQKFEAEVRLDGDGKVTGHMRQVFRNDTEFIFRLAYRRVPEAQWKELAQRISQSMGFGGDVSSVVVSKPDDTSKPFEVSYDYERKKYSDWEDRQITPPLPPLGIESYKDDEKAPKEPLYLGAPGEVLYRAKLELPAGYTADPPRDVHLVTSYAEYHSTYEVKDKVFTAVRRLVLKKSEVPIADWDDYKVFRKAVTEDENRYTRLNSASDAFTAGVAKNATEIQTEFQEGTDAMQRRDLKTAEESFKSVLEKDPKYPGAHFNLAYVYVMQNRRGDAYSEIQKETEVNPSNFRAYAMMASYQMLENKQDEAIAVWRKYLVANPAAADGSIALSQLLIREKKYDEAVGVLETAQKKAPENRGLKVNLGLAYLKDGKNDQGTGLIREIGDDGSVTPETLNNLAYSLVDAGVSLDLAKTYAERAVHDLESKSLNPSMGDEIGLDTTYWLSLTWDTLGWTYFRMNDLPKAGSYLRASWVLGQHAVVGGHLGQYYEKVGKPKEAAHAYVLALAAVANSTAPGSVPKDDMDLVRARYKKLTGVT
ncbi:MAG TPA: DUF3857 domain-containing protein, partial [Terriglobales bacterium]